MTTIQALLGLTPVKAYTSSKATPRQCPDPTLLYGLELETEKIPCEPTELYVGGMGGEPDGSLRNIDNKYSWEYITKPASFSVAYTILENFFNKSKFTSDNYSERCSVHVHVNVQDFTVDQLKAVCYLYQVFERNLYDFARGDRDKNIFCVPWHQCLITSTLLDTLVDGNLPNFKRWQKYTGLNLIPISDKGTIEFRHLPGTANINTIATWMQLIGCIMSYGRNTNVEELQKEIVNLNTNSQYRQFFYRVFREYASALETPNMEILLEEGVVDVKYVLIRDTNKPKKYILDDAARARIAAIPRPRGIETAFVNEWFRANVAQPRDVVMNQQPGGDGQQRAGRRLNARTPNQNLIAAGYQPPAAIYNDPRPPVERPGDNEPAQAAANILDFLVENDPDF